MAPTRVRPSASTSQVSAPPSKRPKIPLAILDPRSVSVASYVLTHVVHTLFSQPTAPLPHLESSVAFTHASLWKSRKRSFEEEEVEGIKDNERLEVSPCRREEGVLADKGAVVVAGQWHSAVHYHAVDCIPRTRSHARRHQRTSFSDSSPRPCSQ
jgi:hypothetical protein